MSMQGHWAAAIWDAPHVFPTGLRTWNRSDPLQRMAVYRNNVMVSLVDALAQTYPVSLQLVGKDFFRAMAQVFVRTYPPRTRVLAHYGQELPSFIAQFPPAAHLAYLCDVAELEWLRLQALHAADVQVDEQTILALVQDADALPMLHWQLVPSLFLFRTAHAAVSIWAAHQAKGGIDLGDVNTDQAEAALVFRSGLDVMVLQVDTGTASLVDLLQGNVCFGEAVAQVQVTNLDFDLSRAMALLMRHELLSGALRTDSTNHPSFPFNPRRPS